MGVVPRVDLQARADCGVGCWGTARKRFVAQSRDVKGTARFWPEGDENWTFSCLGSDSLLFPRLLVTPGVQTFCAPSCCSLPAFPSTRAGVEGPVFSSVTPVLGEEGQSLQKQHAL